MLGCSIWFCGWVVVLRATVYGADGAVRLGTIRTVHTTYSAALKTTTHPQTRCTKPYAATQHLSGHKRNLQLWTAIQYAFHARRIMIQLSVDSAHCHYLNVGFSCLVCVGCRMLWRHCMSVFVKYFVSSFCLTVFEQARSINTNWS